MRKNSKLIVAVFLLTGVAFVATSAVAVGGSHFDAPDIISASDIPYPINNISSGLVSVSVSLTAVGAIQKVQVVRDVPGLTPAVTNAIDNWTFAPGKLDGKPVASTINIHVVFNPANLQSLNLKILPGPATAPPTPPGYSPPQISRVFYSAYPANSVATGSVVLDMVIDRYSQVKKITPLGSVPSLTAPAIAAVKSWTVNPATFNEKKTNANLVAVFVFRAPVN